MILRVRDLVCSRGGVPVLSRLSFDVSEGEALVLRGPNGSGKTTLLRVLAGLAPASGGSIEVEAESVAYGGHADGIKGTLSVAENLEFWASVFGVSGIDDALDDFQLRALAERQAQSLSAGQKRRVGLARLVLTGRPLWLLDEPTVSLDAASVVRFAGVVRRHLEAGGAAVIATHVPLNLKGRDLDLSGYRATGNPTSDDPFDEAFA